MPQNPHNLQIQSKKVPPQKRTKNVECEQTNKSEQKKIQLKKKQQQKTETGIKKLEKRSLMTYVSKSEIGFKSTCSGKR